MSLSPAQAAALKAYVAADQVLNAYPNTADGADALAKVLNAPAVPAFPVWRTDTPVKDIRNAITFSAYTPNDAADGTSLFTNRALLAQTKQMNLQIMLQGVTQLDCSGAQVRADLRDAVTQLPTGASGGLVSAGGSGGVTVLTACTRPAKLIEKILVGVPAATGPVTANLLAYEGEVNYADVQAARNG